MEVKTVLILFIHGFMGVVCSSNIAMLSFSPVVKDSGRSSLICKDTSESLSKATFSIRREFRWAGSTVTESSSSQPAWNGTAISETWNGDEASKAVGGFGCGTGKDAVSVFKMRFNGSFIPVEFSVMSSIGGKVVIKMTNMTDERSRVVTWYKDGQALDVRANSKIWTVNNGKSLVITSLLKEDAGIYMAHFDGENKTYAAGTILKVRDCPLGRWSANCSETCRSCHNGGVCDEESGNCLCLPGFYGDLCESACSPSYFGQNCQDKCSDIGLGETTCKSLQHCSKIGCSCFNGWAGIDCSTACPDGFYGAGCDLECNCLNGGRCDRFAGCRCGLGFSGSACEISEHENTVHRSAEITTTTELSPRIFSEESKPIITNIEADPSWMVNVKQNVKISCTVTGNPTPGHGAISLEYDNGNRIPPSTSKMSEISTKTIFKHRMTSYAGPFWCVAKTSAGQARKAFNFTIPVVPTPLQPPTLIQKRPAYLKIRLNSFPHHGDGPIVKRILLWKKTGGPTYKSFFNITNDTAVLRALDPYTDYTFRVLLQREGGPSGMGHPGPTAVIKTFCNYPLEGPTIKNIYAKNDTILFMSWSLPPTEQIRGEVLGYKIRYKILGDDSTWTKITFAYGSKTSTTLADMRPLAVYSVQIRLYNCAGDSPDSEEVRVTMGRLEMPAGPEVTLVNKTSRTASFQWLVPSNAKSYTISGYEISVFMKEERVLFVNVSACEHTVRRLTPYTVYRFNVKAYNHEGPGNSSRDEIFRTEEEAPSAPSHFRVASIELRSVKLEWNEPQNPNGIIRYYILNYTSQGAPWTSVNVGKAAHFSVKNLQEFHEYQFKIQAVTIEPGNWTKRIIQKTMTSRPLQAPGNIRVDLQSPRSVLFSWDPPPLSDYVHKIRKYKISYTDDVRQNIEHWNSKLVDGDVRSQLVEELRPGTVYFYAIAAVTMKTGVFSEGPKSFRTSTLTIPPAPRDVTFTNVTSNSVIIGWNVANGYDVNNVQLRWKSMSSSGAWKVLLFTNEDSSATLERLEPETYYNIELVALNAIGQSGPMATHFSTIKAEYKPKVLLLAAVIGAVATIIIVVVLFLFLYCRRRRRLKADEFYRQDMELMKRHEIKRQSTIGSSFNAGAITTRSMTLLSSHSHHSVNSKTPSNCETPLMVPDHMILSWESIFFEDVTLGEGNFGQVVKAIIQIDGKCIDAAVKMLKDGCSIDDRKDFLAELDMMVRLGKHPNIISLLGACEHNASLYLCTEFAPNGNLLQFLRKSRKAGGEATYTYLTQGQLLQFALDICQGMSYLSEQEMIHRDLAARNILLSENLTCKVSDFGLSRGEGVYVKRTVARLPIRWMAIESLNYNVYTSQSDVWSFGVVLWEIVSLGGTPYYGMSCAELYEKLPKGYRMEQPLNCDEEIYKVMCQCWKDRPHERPSFPQLSVALRRMIEARTNINYVNTAIFENFSFFKIDANEEQED